MQRFFPALAAIDLATAAPRTAAAGAAAAAPGEAAAPSPDADRPAPSDRGVHVWPESQPRTRLSQHHLPPMQRPVCNNSSGLASESKPTLLATTRSCELLHAP